MKSEYGTPFRTFWGLGIFMIVVGVFFMGNVVDINIYDTYYVFDAGYLGTFNGSLLLIVGLGYWFSMVFKGRLISWLTSLHIYLTIGCFVLMAVMGAVLTVMSKDPERSMGNIYTSLNLIFWGAMLVLIFAQMIYPINLILGFFKRTN